MITKGIEAEREQVGGLTLACYQQVPVECDHPRRIFQARMFFLKIFQKGCWGNDLCCLYF